MNASNKQQLQGASEHHGIKKPGGRRGGGNGIRSGEIQGEREGEGRGLTNDGSSDKSWPATAAGERPLHEASGRGGTATSGNECSHGCGDLRRDALMRKGLVQSGENCEDDRRCKSAELREGGFLERGRKNKRKTQGLRKIGFYPPALVWANARGRQVTRGVMLFLHVMVSFLYGRGAFRGF